VRSKPTVIAEAWRLALLALICLVLGLSLGNGQAGIIVGLLLLSGWWGYQLKQLLQWLEQPMGKPAKAGGVLGLIVDRICQLQRQSEAAQLQLASALVYLQDSLGSMRDASIIVDAQDQIAWANKSAEHLLGVHHPQDRGQRLQDLIHLPPFTAYYEAGDYSCPLRIPPSTDGEPCLQVEISRFGMGDRLIFARDSTESYRLEQMRRDFVSNVSHELRTPLTVIKGYTQTILELGSLTGGPLQQPLRQIDEQSQRMETLLIDLLWLAQIESIEGQGKTAVVDVVSLLVDLQSTLQTAWTQRDIQLEISTERTVVGDEVQLHSAFSNLIINALKYSVSGPILLRWYELNGIPVFAVSDSGVGVAPHHISRLTERFYRVDKSRSQRIGGTGLGLAIVKHIAVSHQAELAIDSQLDVGSTFSLAFRQSKQ